MESANNVQHCVENFYSYFYNGKQFFPDRKLGYSVPHRDYFRSTDEEMSLSGGKLIYPLEWLNALSDDAQGRRVLARLQRREIHLHRQYHQNITRQTTYQNKNQLIDPTM